MPYRDIATRLKYQRLYNAVHRDQLRQLSKERYAGLSENELEERRIRNRAFYARNKETILAKRRIKKQSLTKEQLEQDYLYHKKYSNDWAKLNRDKRLASLNKRRALERKSTIGAISYEDIYTRDNNRCQICGKKVAKGTRSFDHIIPLSLNGSHSQINLQLTHLLCNVKRGNGRIPAQIRILP